MSVRAFVDEHYRHFNAGALQSAAASLTDFLESGGKLFVTLAGAMSTAELGRSLAPMIRSGHVAGISCTGANLEEDVFNLVAHNSYVHLEDWRNLSAVDDAEFLKRKLNRVTDVCIPEEQAFRKIEHHIMSCWAESEQQGVSRLPHEFFYQMLVNSSLESSYEAQPEHSWLLAAAEMELPLFVPGWEDSTLGNIFAARCLEGKFKPLHRSKRHRIHDGTLPMVRIESKPTCIPANWRWNCWRFPYLRGSNAEPRPRTRGPDVELVLSNQ